MKRDIITEITADIIGILEAGTVPWKKPWKGGAWGMPKNMVSNKPYNGINLVRLGFTDFSSPYWLTFKQCRDLGGSVLKGEKGEPVVYWQFTDKNKDKDDDDKKKSFAFMKYFTVFNTDQCKNIEVEPPPEVQGIEFNPIEECEKVCANYTGPALTHGGNRAFYRPSTDSIKLPEPEHFISNEEYYSTRFHEMVHSTGHETRLKREGIGGHHYFGDNEYSKEELIAEMGAAFICAFTGIENKTIDNSAAYLNGWIKVLRAQPKILLSAAQNASKAFNLITV